MPTVRLQGCRIKRIRCTITEVIIIELLRTFSILTSDWLRQAFGMRRLRGLEVRKLSTLALRESCSYVNCLPQTCAIIRGIM